MRHLAGDPLGAAVVPPVPQEGKRSGITLLAAFKMALGTREGLSLKAKQMSTFNSSPAIEKKPCGENVDC